MGHLLTLYSSLAKLPLSVQPPPIRPQLAPTDEWVLPISDSPKPPSDRITLTLPVINAAKEVQVVALGESKVRGQGGKEHVTTCVPSYVNGDVNITFIQLTSVHVHEWQRGMV